MLIPLKVIIRDSASTPSRSRNTAPTVDTVPTAPSASAWNAPPVLRFHSSTTPTEHSAAAAPASVAVKMPDSMPPTITSINTGTGHTCTRLVSFSFQGTLSVLRPRFGPARSLPKTAYRMMARVKRIATRMPGPMPASSCFPTGTSAIPAYSTSRMLGGIS